MTAAEPTLQQLADQLAEQAVLLERLNAARSVQAGEILALREALAAGGPRETEPPRKVPPEWTTIDDEEEAARLLADLAAWVQATWSVYHSVPSCWPWHPDVVSRLLSMQLLWQLCMKPGAPPSAHTDWVIRWLPSAVREITPRLQGCHASTGHQHLQRKWTVDHGHLTELARWWAHTHDRDAALVPGLTPKEQ